MTKQRKNNMTEQKRREASERLRNNWMKPEFRKLMEKRDFSIVGEANRRFWAELPPLPEGMYEAEFWRNVNKECKNGCWEYRKNICDIGYAYGKFQVNGEMITSPPRAAYGWTYGNAPKGRKVLHTCGNKLCVNPDHLRLSEVSTESRVANRMPYEDADLRERLESNVEKKAETGCWEWLRSIGNHGYGQIWCGDTVKPTHRLAYELYVGPLQEGEYVLHNCHNKKCCNPKHLRTGTQSENMKEYAALYKQNIGPMKFTDLDEETRARRSAKRAENLAKRRELKAKQMVENKNHQ